MSSTRRRRKGCATQSSQALEERRSVEEPLGKDSGNADGSVDREEGSGGELGGIAAGGRKDAAALPLGDDSGDGTGNAASAGDIGGDKELVDSDDERPDMLWRVDEVSTRELSQS